MKEIYKNLSLSCGSDNCLFVEIDENDYTVCNCGNTNDTQAFIENVYFNPTSLYNLDIALCIETLTTVYIIFYFKLN